MMRQTLATTFVLLYPLLGAKLITHTSCACTYMHILQYPGPGQARMRIKYACTPASVRSVRRRNTAPNEWGDGCVGAHKSLILFIA
jgi:hypothetical protein